jgi:dihydrodipicolinate synthase/N-acetylneuraminate lyase
MDSAVKEKRLALITRLFGDGIPQLWCPPLTYYTDDGQIDFPRMTAHLTQISRTVKGFLSPGSTGDGWELTDDEVRQLLAFDLDIATKLNVKILIGILKTDARTAHESIIDTLAWLKGKTGLQSNEELITKTGFCGFTVCPPKGKDLSQEQIYQALLPIMQLKVPVALYQLPQVTENEIAPETVARFAAEFENFYLLKDTSGNDRVALSGLDFHGLYLVRGAEGDYHKWLRTNHGPYDGFLLGTANSFGLQLAEIINHVTAGNLDAAKALSDKLTALINEVFKYAAPLPGGNPFTNANKAVDHFFAHGPNALNVPPPRLHSGDHLPTDLLNKTAHILTHYILMPSTRYYEG